MSEGDYKKREKQKWKRKELENLGFLWQIHFGDTHPKNAKCFDCEDYQTNVCKGGEDPVKCMVKSARCTAGKFYSGVLIGWGRAIRREIERDMRKKGKFILSLYKQKVMDEEL